jgi:hypothetical protein
MTRIFLTISILGVMSFSAIQSLKACVQGNHEEFLIEEGECVLPLSSPKTLDSLTQITED